MKIHNKLIKSTAVAEKTDLWDNFIIAILTRTGLHSLWFSARVRLKRSKPPLCVAVAICPKGNDISENVHLRSLSCGRTANLDCLKRSVFDHCGRPNMQTIKVHTKKKLNHVLWSSNNLFWWVFEWHLIDKLKRSASGSHSQESVSKTKWQKLLKQRFIIGSNKPKDYHNTDTILEELKKESHKTSMFRVEFRENLALLACFWARHGYQNVAS